MADKLTQYLASVKTNFPFCVTEAWRLYPLPEPGDIQLDAAEWLQNGPNRRGILGWRGFSKTWLACLKADWNFLVNVNERQLLISAGKDSVKDSMRFARQWINALPFMRHLAPRHRSFGEVVQQDNLAAFDVGPAKWDRVPSMSIVGMTGQLPSRRATKILLDDVETNENSMTRDQRIRILDRVDQAECILTPDGEIVVLGTYHHEESTYHELRKRGYIFRAYPVIYPGPGENVPDLAPILQKRLDDGLAEPGDPVWPERFSRDWCIEKRSHVSPRTWAMQFMLRTDLCDAELYPLKLRDLIIYPCNRDKAPASLAWGTMTSRGPTTINDIPCTGFGADQFYGPAMVDEQWLPYAGCAAWLDPAAGGLDKMALAIVGQLRGYLHAKHVDGMKGGATNENLERIVQALRDHDARELWIEQNFGGEYIKPLIEPVIRRYACRAGENAAYPQGWGCATYTEHSSGMKESRIINVLAPIMQQHRLILDPKVAANVELTHQMTRIREERGALEHEDELESLAGACSRHKNLLHQDANAIGMNERERAQLAIVEKYRRKFAHLHHKNEPKWAET